MAKIDKVAEVDLGAPKEEVNIEEKPEEEPVQPEASIH
jgi:hypothetical protein